MTGRIDLTKNMVSISMRMKDKKTCKNGDNPILTFLRYQSGRKIMPLKTGIDAHGVLYRFISCGIGRQAFAGGRAKLTTCNC